MTTRARFPTERIASDAYDLGDRYALGGLLPDDRIGPPPARKWRKFMLWCVVLLLACGGGWALIEGHVDVAKMQGWFKTITVAMSPPVDRKMPAPPERLPPIPTEEITSSPPSPELATRASVFAASPSLQPDAGPGAAAKSPPLTTGSLPPAATGGEEPLPPANPDPSDRYQMRAAAVGLHPDLSRVLLTRLSATDYRNAGIAIQKALAEASDDEVFVWPRQRKPELALFKVRFVPGAAGGCRRYVASVTKDGWLTTALPMEKCGSGLRQARRG